MKSLTEAIRPTAIIRSSKLNRHLGLDLTIAAETFQHTGSFKFRAGYNVAASVPNEAIIAASSGNFGQALAYACQLLGKKCTIVMPATSARVKIEAVNSFGAEVDLIDTASISRSERVAQLAEQMSDPYVASAYDDEFVIEGNATLGDELSGMGFDAVIVPVGGGGLLSGVIKSFSRNGDQADIYGAEPLLGNDAARSMREGQLIANETEPATIADGARTVSLGKLNWPLIQNGAKEILEVPDERIAEAVKLYFGLANLKTEPTGALSLGAVLQFPEHFRERKVCIIVSGGNVDPDVYRNLI